MLTAKKAIGVLAGLVFINLAWLQQVDPSKQIILDTTAELATITVDPASLDGRLVKVLDRGGYECVYSATDLEAEDGGFVHNGPSGVGQFAVVDRSEANIVLFGATPDDAVDDSAAIQAAITSGKDVVIPRSEFTINSTLSLVSNTVIRGTGPESKIRATTNLTMFSGSADDDIKVDGVHFVGANLAATNIITHGNAFYFNNCDRISITNCEFEIFSVSPCQIDDCTNVRYTDNYSHDAGSNAHATQSSGFLTWGNNVGVVISDNVMTSDVSQGIYCGALDGDKNFVVSGNYIDTLDAAGAQIIPPVLKRHCIVANYDNALLAQVNTFANTITGNTLVNAKWSGIYNQGSARGIAITGNTIRQTGQDNNSLGGGIVFSGGNDTLIAAGNAVISGNMITDLGGDTGPAAIKLVGNQSLIGDVEGRVLVTGNFIANCTCRGIWITGDMGRAHIVGNQVFDVQKQAIAVVNNATGTELAKGENLIANNRLEVSGTVRGIFLDDVNPDTYLIQGNVIKSKAILDGAFDASAGTFPRAENGQVLIVETGGTIDGLTMAAGEWVQSSADQATSSSSTSWAVITHEGGGLTDSQVAGIYAESDNVIIRGNNFRGWSSAVYFPTSYSGRELDPPRMSDNNITDCHGGLVVRATSNGLVPIDPSNRIVRTENPYGDGDGGGYTVGAVVATLKDDGRIIFYSDAAPIASPAYVQGDIALHGDFESGDPVSWTYDGTSWEPLIP